MESGRGHSSCGKQDLRERSVNALHRATGAKRILDWLDSRSFGGRRVRVQCGDCNHGNTHNRSDLVQLMLTLFVIFSHPLAIFLSIRRMPLSLPLRATVAALRGAGSVPGQTFTGSALGTHSHTLTPAGTNSAPGFTGTPATLTGSNSVPGFTGTQFDNRSSFRRVIFCSKD